MSQIEPIEESIRGAWSAWRRSFVGSAQATLALSAAIIIAGLCTGLMGYNPVRIVTALVAGPLTDAHRFAECLARATPLALTGLSVAIAFRCQAWNIGAEGQYVLGAIVAAAWAALRSKREVRDFLDALEEQLKGRRLGVAEVTAFRLIAAKRGLVSRRSSVK